MKLTDVPHLEEIDPSIEDVHDIFRREPSYTPVLPCWNLGESRETDAALSEFEYDSMDDEENPPFFYKVSKGQAGGQVSMHINPCPAISPHSGGGCQIPRHNKGTQKRRKV